MAIRPTRSSQPYQPRAMSDMRRRLVPSAADRARASGQTTTRQPQIRRPQTPRGPLPAATGPRRKVPRKLKLVLWVTAIVGIYILLTSHRTVTVKAVAPTKPQTVCLDPGHGGADPGATNGAFTERDINLTVALKVRDILTSQGYRVYLTRTTNTPNLANINRYSYCNQKHATILVSIHHNFFDDPSVDHDTALYFKPTDLPLATSLVAATSHSLGLLNNGIAQFEDGVLSKSTMPAALSEGFFLTSSHELAALGTSDSTRLSGEASGIATGIVNYFTAPPASPAATNSVPQVLNRDE